MSEQPLTLAVLAQFHREIILPDVQRIVGEAIGASERRMQGNFDAIFHKLDKLETEYESLKVGLARVEGRLDLMEQRFAGLEALYRDLLAAVNRLEERLSRVEKQIDVIGAAQESEPLRAEVADLRTRVDSLQAQVSNLEARLPRKV